MFPNKFLYLGHCSFNKPTCRAARKKIGESELLQSQTEKPKRSKQNVNV